MASGMNLPSGSGSAIDMPREPRRETICVAIGIALLFVIVTRWPVGAPGRSTPTSSDSLRRRRRTGFPCTTRCS